MESKLVLIVLEGTKEMYPKTKGYLSGCGSRILYECPYEALIASVPGERISDVEKGEGVKVVYSGPIEVTKVTREVKSSSLERAAPFYRFYNNLLQPPLPGQEGIKLNKPQK